MASSASSGPPSALTLPNVIHFLQTEAIKYERDRNYWELERSEMKARIAKLEGERKASERMKNWYLRRLRMMETALQAERRKNDPDAKVLPCVTDMEDVEKPKRSEKKGRLEHDETYQEIIRTSRQGLADQAGRNKSRTYLEKCLLEVTYLVNSLPTITSNKFSGTTATQETDVQPRDSFVNNIPEAPSNYFTSTTENSTIALSASSPFQPQEYTTNGTSLYSLGRPVTHEEPQESEEMVEQIQHVYDRSGNFIESPKVPALTSPASDPDDPDVVVSDTWASTEDQWDFRDIIPARIDMPEVFALQATLKGKQGATASVCAFTIGNDSWLATASHPGTIELYGGAEKQVIELTLEEPELVTCLMAHAQPGSTMVHIYCGDSEAIIRKWEVDVSVSADSRRPLTPCKTFISHSKPITGLALVTDTLVSISKDGALRTWNTNSGDTQGVWWGPQKGQGVTPSAICVVTSTVCAIGYTDSSVIMYDIEHDKPGRSMPGVSEAVGQDIKSAVTHLTCMGEADNPILVCLYAAAAAAATSSSTTTTPCQHAVLFDTRKHEVAGTIDFHAPVLSVATSGPYLATLQADNVTFYSVEGAAVGQLDVTGRRARHVASLAGHATRTIYVTLEDGQILLCKHPQSQ